MRMRVNWAPSASIAVFKDNCLQFENILKTGNRRAHERRRAVSQYKMTRLPPGERIFGGAPRSLDNNLLRIYTRPLTEGKTEHVSQTNKPRIKIDHVGTTSYFNIPKRHP